MLYNTMQYYTIQCSIKSILPIIYYAINQKTHFIHHIKTVRFVYQIFKCHILNAIVRAIYQHIKKNKKQVTTRTY